jgi:hypothetical protein
MLTRHARFRVVFLTAALLSPPLTPPVRHGAAAQSTGGAGDVRADEGIHRPLPSDMIEGYADGTVVALHYSLSYSCPTTPASDLDPPFGKGDGHPQSEDPTEYQLPPCFVGDTGTGSILPTGLASAAFPGVRHVYGMVPFFGGAIADSNNPSTDVQTQCSQPGMPYTRIRGAPGTCLMHPSTWRMAMNPGDPAHQVPDPAPAANHSHVVEGTRWPSTWWNVVGVLIYDRAVWPDLDGNCPAGRNACVTSLQAIRAGQARGQAGADTPTNVFLYFSVTPEAGSAG